MLEGLLKNHNDVVNKEENILAHRDVPRNVLQLQFNLALELYKINHNGQVPNYDEREMKNELINYWIDVGYSKWFRLLSDEKEKRHEDPMGITLEEVEGFKSVVDSR